MTSLPHILYLEDSSLSQKLMSKNLDGVGRVTCCATSAEASALVEAQEFDLIIADYQLVGEDAVAFMRRVRSQFAHAELPLLAVSSAMDRVLRGTVYRAGATAAMAKPIGRGELQEMIKLLLADPRPLWQDYVDEVRTITWFSQDVFYEYAPHLQVLASGATAEEAHDSMHRALSERAAGTALPIMTPIGRAVHHFASPRDGSPAPDAAPVGAGIL